MSSLRHISKAELYQMIKVNEDNVARLTELSKSHLTDGQRQDVIKLAAEVYRIQGFIARVRAEFTRRMLGGK